MRRSTAYIIFVFCLAGVLIALLGLHSSYRRSEQGHRTRAGQEAVERLGLTDLCLFPEARYTRHPSQADLHAPFQDHPLSLEHFTSGSILAPPAHVRTGR